jgi:hypothetical protein
MEKNHGGGQRLPTKVKKSQILNFYFQTLFYNLHCDWNKNELLIFCSHFQIKYSS